jgi:serine/threonine protein kinase
VFLASDPFSDGKEVAIKRMRSWAPVPDAPSSDFSNRFFSAEAALAGQLNHPNVVAILDAVAEASSPYLVMEYVSGVTLKHFCRSDRLLPLDQIVEVAFKCAMALGYVYRQGLIHRDVKPANLLAVLDASGQVVDVKVSDFGSALNLNADSTQIHRVVRRAAPDGADAPDLPPAAAAADGAARGRHGGAGCCRAAGAGQGAARTLPRLGWLRAGAVQPRRHAAGAAEPARRGA